MQRLHKLGERVGNRLGHVVPVLSNLVDLLHAARLTRVRTAVEQVGQLLGLRRVGTCIICMHMRMGMGMCMRMRMCISRE